MIQRGLVFVYNLYALRWPCVAFTPTITYYRVATLIYSHSWPFLSKWIKLNAVKAQEKLYSLCAKCACAFVGILFK